MKYVLMLFLYDPNGPTMTTQEFESMDACQHAITVTEIMTGQELRLTREERTGERHRFVFGTDKTLTSKSWAYCAHLE